MTKDFSEIHLSHEEEYHESGMAAKFDTSLFSPRKQQSIVAAKKKMLFLCLSQVTIKLAIAQTNM